MSLSERAWAMANVALHQQFNVMARDPDLDCSEEARERFLWNCEALDEVARLCGVSGSLRMTFRESAEEWLLP